MGLASKRMPSSIDLSTFLLLMMESFNNNHKMNNNPHLWSVYHVTGSILDASHAFSPLIFTMTLSSKPCCYPHVTGEETEA